MKTRRRSLIVIAAAAALAAQPPRGVSIRVSETAGIRRFNYPVSARVPLPKGALTETANLRMTLDGKEIPVQYTAESRRPDGSIEWLDADMNVNSAPSQTQLLQLEYGPGVTSTATSTAAPRGLALTEDADSIHAGNVRLGRNGKPLLLSVKYRGEDIGSGLNTLVITDTAGRTHDLSEATGLKTEIVKRGPFLIVVRYTGRLPLDSTYSVPFTVTAETPNSKSMVRIAADIEDRAHRVREISLHTPLAFGPLPWVWDFGTGRWSYGSFRNAQDSVALTETVTAAGSDRWDIKTGTQGVEEPYETSGAGQAEPVRWGHFQDGKEVVAFALDMLPEQTGVWLVTFNGSGQASYSFAPAGPAVRRHFAVYQHFVNTPVQIGAATSPASILTPLSVAIVP